MIFQGVERVKTIRLTHEEDGDFIKVGDYGVLSITVIPQNGQMAAVPWFLVELEGGVKEMYNGATLASVGLYREGET